MLKFTAAAILAVSAFAQQTPAPVGDATTRYPEWASYFVEGSENAAYAWDAYQVTSKTGYEKTLFRITGNAKNTEMNKDTVFIMHGAFSNVLSWFNEVTYTGSTGDAYVAIKDAELLAAVQANDPTAVFYLEAVKEKLPDVWAGMLKKYAAKPIKIDLEDFITNADKSLVSEEEQSCLVDSIDETIMMYEQSLAVGAGYVSAPHVSLPLLLADQGYDVWVGGHRGTLYQRGHASLDSAVDEDYWGWGNVEMATEDLPAEIELILSAAGKETLSYIGYSMGTMNMYYALGTASNNDMLNKTLNKVDRFLSLASCQYVDYVTDKSEEQTQAYFDQTENTDVDFFFGAGSDTSASVDFICLLSGNYEGCVDENTLYADYYDTTTVQTWRWFGQNSLRKAMLNNSYPEYVNESAKPNREDFIDWSTVSGTDVYHFVSANDATCVPEQAQFMEDRIPTFIKKTEYKCNTSHEWFGGRGISQQNMIMDMVDALESPVVHMAEIEEEDIPDAASYLNFGATLVAVTASLMLM